MSSAQDRAEAGARTAQAQAPGSQTQAVPPQASYDQAAYGEPASGRLVAQTGFTVLASVLMMLAGLWGFFEGLVAITRQSFFATVPQYTYHWTVHSWGWVHFGLGIVLFAAGACVLLGQTWARVIGIVLAVFSGIANFMFLPYYPVWSIIMIALDVFVIWALATMSMNRQAA